MIAANAESNRQRLASRYRSNAPSESSTPSLRQQPRASASARLCFVILGFLVCGDGAMASPIEDACSIPIALPHPARWVRDVDTSEPACQLLEVPASPTPFVNGVGTFPWSDVASREGSAPSRGGKFFQIIGSATIRYVGRRSYVDGRSDYRQQILGKPLVRHERSGNTSRITAHSVLRVKWLKPMNDEVLAPTVETYDCLDAAVYDATNIVFLNWCAVKGSAEASALPRVASSLGVPR